MAPRRRPATLDDLLTKPARTHVMSISIPKDGTEVELTLALTALSAKAYDDLLAAHPPTKEQKAEGEGYNPDTFAPAVIAAVVTEPKLTVEQATEIWTGETWNRGELRDLFLGCVNLCSKGLDVPFTSLG